MSSRVGSWLVASVGAVALAAPRAAAAYPSSVVYAPDARVLPFGTLSAQVYGALRLNPTPVHTGDGWAGLDAGVLPRHVYARTRVGELAFGGAELGFDFFGPDVTGGLGFVLNAKVQALAETEYLPEVAVGLFQFAPDLARGAHVGYVTVGKALRAGGIDLGRVAVGFARSFAGGAHVAPGCLAAEASCVFRGSAPGFEDQNGALILGYESPRWGPVTLAVDHLGGTSAVSGTNVAVNAYVADVFYGGVGVWLANDRRPAPPGPGVADGVFAYLGATVDVGAWLRARSGAAPRPAAPASVPASGPGTSPTRPTARPASSVREP